MQWYYALSGRQLGPVSIDEMQNLARSGAIQPETLIWRAGMANWIPAAQVTELTLPFPSLPPGPTPGVSPAVSPYAPPPSSFRSGGMPPAYAENISGTGPLVLGIISALFCCLPFGVVAIVYAAQVGTKVARRDYDGARSNVKTSYIWSGVSIGIGVIISAIYFALVAAGIAVE